MRGVWCGNDYRPKPCDTRHTHRESNVDVESLWPGIGIPSPLASIDPCIAIPCLALCVALQTLPPLIHY
jgi:hypothetical protein